jgi:hypothetical protein
MRLCTTVPAAALLLCAVAAYPADLSVADATLDGGLCVVLPADDGAALCALTNHGHALVQGLAVDDASLAGCRDAIADQSLTGIATVIRATSLKRLPYADNLVNLLVADLDSLGDKNRNLGWTIRGTPVQKR